MPFKDKEYRKVYARSAARLYRERHPEKIVANNRKNLLRRNFGLTLDQYNEMFQAQKGLCLGCYRHQSSMTRTLAVDHSHSTGKIRGLLCAACNPALGLVHDDPIVLRRLADYLDTHK